MFNSVEIDIMPGANCSVFGCPTSRRHNISIFKLPTPKNEFNKNWREDILKVITRDRVVDPKFKNQIVNDRVYICERHFNENEFYYCKFIS